MDKGRFLTDLTSGAQAMGVRLDGLAGERMFLYFTELQRWNRRVNLVSRRQDDWLRIHFLDSLAPLGAGLLEGAGRVVDLGAGAGFPGVALKIAATDISLGLAEASSRKCAWLKHLVRELGLQDVMVLEGRFEDLLEQGWAASFDVAVSRAAARPRSILAMARPFLDHGGRIIVYTTEALTEPGRGKVHHYRVPGSRVPSVLWEVGEESARSPVSRE